MGGVGGCHLESQCAFEARVTPAGPACLLQRNDRNFWRLTDVKNHVCSQVSSPIFSNMYIPRKGRLLYARPDRAHHRDSREIGHWRPPLRGWTGKGEASRIILRRCRWWRRERQCVRWPSGRPGGTGVIARVEARVTSSTSSGTHSVKSLLNFQERRTTTSSFTQEGTSNGSTRTAPLWTTPRICTMGGRQYIWGHVQDARFSECMRVWLHLSLSASGARGVVLRNDSW